MTTMPPRSTNNPRWDNLDDGFVSPARLQQWKEQENRRIQSFGTSTPLASPPSQAPPTRPTSERRNTSADSYSSTNGSPNKHRSKPSFTAFFSRKSVQMEERPQLLSPPLAQDLNPLSANGPMPQSQNTPPSVSPQRGPSVDNANLQDPSRMMQQQHPSQQSPQNGSSDVVPAASNIPQSPQAQGPSLHPEIRSVVQLTLAHAHKIYFSGPLVRKIERQPDGQKPQKDEGWREVWAQLGGTTLSVWDMEEIQQASQQGRQIPPAYINVTDGFVNVLGSIALPQSPGVPQQRYHNVLTLNTAGSNLYLFSCPSADALVQWTAALRLSAWEKSRLEEIYTAHLIRITLNDGSKTPTPLINSRLEGWVRIRVAGQTDWKRMWMVITAGNHLGHRDHDSISSMGNDRPESPDAPRKKRMSNLFLRDKHPAHPNIPLRPMIQLFASQRPKDRKKVLLTMRSASQAFAVYPERPELISRSTLMKLEGQLGDEEMAGVLKLREAWLLIMPELEGANTRASEMLKWIIAIHDAFELYGRPGMYSWDPREVQSMMFAYPIGRYRDSLFLDRELADTLDPRDDRTSAIRSQLQRILLDRMNDAGPGGITGPADTESPPTLPPLPSVTNGELHVSTPPPVPGKSNGPSSLQLPPLSFDSSPINANNSGHAEDNQRPLSPITERSTPLEGRSLSLDKPSGSKSESMAPTQVYAEETASSILQQPLVSSPIASNFPPEHNLVSRGSPEAPNSRPDSKLSHRSQRSSQIASAPSWSSGNQPSSPAFAVNQARRQVSPERRPATPLTPPRFAATSPRSFSPPRASSPLHATSPQPPESLTAPPAEPLPATTIRMVPNRSISQLSIPTSIDTISTLTSRGSYTGDPIPGPPKAALSPHSLPLATSPQSLLPTTVMSQRKASLADDILGDTSAALFYMQHMHKGGDAMPMRRSSPPPPNSGDDEASSSESDHEPPSRAMTSPSRTRQANSPPLAPAAGRKSHGDQSAVAREATSAASRPSSGLRNRPSGARAAPSTRMSAYLQNSSSKDGDTRIESTIVTSDDKKDDDIGMAAATAVPPAPSFEDPNADALAALSFLEQDDRPAPPALRSTSQITTPASETSPLPEVVETPASPSRTRSAASEQPRSSFAPTRLAAQRKAKTQAQQAAQHAAAHRPGKANGTGRTKPKDARAWGDSSEEEDEEEEEDDEDVDSDAEPPRRMVGSVSDHASASGHGGLGPVRSSYAPTASSSPSRSAVDVNHAAPPSPHRPRDLPQVPGSQYSDEYLGSQPQPRRFLPDGFNEPGRRSLYPGDGGSRGSSPQPSMRPQSQFPSQQPQGPQRPIWSRVLDGDRQQETAGSRDTFIQMEAPATTMTKAFAPHGLLSAGLQDKQDRSAKRQEELARESGASLINVPNKPPPPQTGLLGAVTAHERERKREGGLGAALTEREREKRLVEERQRKLDEFQRQQYDQMQQQGGSMYSGGMMGYNPMMNPMMMGMNPMMTGGWGYPGMMPGFANAQQLFAAQQAAAQAYQQAMVAFSTAGSQVGGNEGQTPAPLNPMMTGNSMGMGFDPRMSMMGMPMMGMTPTGMSGMGMGGMGMGMGGMGMNPMMGGGMGMQMTGGSQFDPRVSPGLEGNPGARHESEANATVARPFSSSSPMPGPQTPLTGPQTTSSEGSQNIPTGNA